MAWTKESFLLRPGEVKPGGSARGPNSQPDSCLWFPRHLRFGCTSVHRLRTPWVRSIGPIMEDHCGSRMAVR